MNYTIPCEKCIHNEVCNLKVFINETKVETTHPFVSVRISCSKFMSATLTLIGAESEVNNGLQQ